MSYELWDTDTGNLLRSYEGIDEALGLVRSAVAAYGRRYVRTWALVKLEPDGAPVTVAVGSALDQLAAEAIPTRVVRSDS
jgi:hypothetical protein